MIPVSYTHLDVYKRQDYRGNTVEAVSSSSYLYGAHCEPGMRVIAEVNESDDSLYVTVYSYDPVSYTHLDVYKRQVCIPRGERRYSQQDIQL